MLKDNKQQYLYKGKLLGLKELVQYIQFDPLHNIFGSVTVYTKKYRIPVKLVFVRNRNKPYEYIVPLSTDCSLPDCEIVSRYGNRWPIECCEDIQDMELSTALRSLMSIFAIGIKNCQGILRPKTLWES